MDKDVIHYSFLIIVTKENEQTQVSKSNTREELMHKLSCYIIFSRILIRLFSYVFLVICVSHRKLPGHTERQ